MDETNTAVATEKRLATLESTISTVLEVVRDIRSHLDSYPSRVATLEEGRTADQGAIGRSFSEIAQVRADLNSLGASVNVRFATAADTSAKIDSRLSKWVYMGIGAGGAVSVLFAVVKAIAVAFAH
jgi:hypothetical protein